MKINNSDDHKSLQSHLDYCLRPLLKHLGWKSDEDYLFESMPHMVRIENIDSFMWIMKNLGYSTKTITIPLSDINEKSFPCLFLANEGLAPVVVLEKVAEGLLIFDSETQENKIISNLKISGIALVFKKKTTELVKEDYRNWFGDVLYNCKGMIFFISLISFFQALLILTVPIYIMFLYNNVINVKAYGTLSIFFVGILLSLSGLLLTMNVRSRLLAYFGGRLQNNIGIIIFVRLLKLQPTYIESAPLSRQLIRLNDFNHVREFFGGPLFSAIFDLPFIFLFLLCIWLLGGVLVIVPLIGIILYAAVAVTLWFFSKKSIRENAIVKAKYQNYLLETFSGMRSLQFSGLQDTWYSRFKEISATSSLYGKTAILFSGASDAIFDGLILIIGLLTLGVGAYLIIDGQIQLGDLIAILFIIWRVLSPVKTLAVMLPKLMQIKKSISQINELMRFPSEIPNEKQWENTPSKILGGIRFDQVAFRYPGFDTLALKNISFSVKAGDTLLILGPTGSGKTTIANLLLNLYNIQGGCIYIDGKNIRQFDVSLLRKNIGYVPQTQELFYGTVEQNLKLVNPLATDAQLQAAITASNLMEDLEQLPEGLNTRIRFYGDYRFGASFFQKMNLARAYLRNASIMLLDEPTTSLDEKNIQIFSEHIKTLKKTKTIIIFEHDTTLIDLADYVIVLYDGFISVSGKPDEILKNIPKGII